MIAFAVKFLALFLGLNWIFSESSFPPARRLIQGLITFQVDAAAAFLGLFGIAAHRVGQTLAGAGFSCVVGEGCNGMIAVSLVLAGILSFPVPPGKRIAGLFLLPPLVVAVNIVRIAALYMAGTTVPDFFNLFHVYVGQVFVIAASAISWWLWLNWASRTSAAVSRPSA